MTAGSLAHGFLSRDGDRRDGTLRSVTDGAGRGAAWWRAPWFLLACILAAAVPLLWPAVPPLGDLPEHIGRYRILAEAGEGPLGQVFAVHWALIGNLGVDLLVLGLHPWLDVEPAAKLVAALIPVVTVAALVWLSVEVHGRFQPTAIFAFPLAYAAAFQMGFVNFCLAQALVLGAMALWLRLARTKPPVWRVTLFAVIAPVIWLCHSFGWALLVALVFGMEWQRQIAQGRRWFAAAVSSGLLMLPMMLPALLMVFAGNDKLSSGAGIEFRWVLKLLWAAALLHEHWWWWDIASASLLLMLVWAGIRSPRLSVTPLLAMPALVAFAGFVLLPDVVQSGAFMDARLLAPAAMLAIVAIRVAPGAPEGRIAAIGTAFFVARIAAGTLALGQIAAAQERELGALAALPVGGKVLVLVDQRPEKDWGDPRRLHLGGLAIARRRVFTNSQWALPGQQLVRPRQPLAAPFDRDPSQIVYDGQLLDGEPYFDAAIRRFDRCAFTHVWTIGYPPGRARRHDLHLAWSGADSAVYRVDRSGCLSARAAVR